MLLIQKTPIVRGVFCISVKYRKEAILLVAQ